MSTELELLRSAAQEIKMLRSQNQIMSARLDVFDSMMAVLHTDIARKSQGMSPDVVYDIEKFIESETKVVKV